MFNWFKYCDGKNCPHRDRAFAILEQSLEREHLLLMRLHNTMNMLHEAETKVYEYEVMQKARSKKKEDAPIPSLLDGAATWAYMKTKGDMRDNMYKGPLTPVPVPLPKKPGRKPKVKAK